MVLRPFLPVLTLNSKSSSTLFPFGFFLFGKCCCTNLEWSGATGWLFSRCSSLGWSKVGTFWHTCSRWPLLFYCPPKLLVFSWVKENVTKSWSELFRTQYRNETQLSVSFWTACCKNRDLITPVGWWTPTGIATCPFSWHCRFCQKNFFVSNIDVWKWRNWLVAGWAKSVWDTDCHFCTFLNTLEAGFVQTYSLVSSVL